MFESYSPRAVYNLKNIAMGDIEFKVYGISYSSTPLPSKLIQKSIGSIKIGLLKAINDEGDSNRCGFIIIHVGEMGVSTLAHWWIQGSVLCQKIHRILHDADVPMDTQKRPVIACVWELALVNAEQEIWRKTMMTDEADLQKYLIARANLQTV